MEEGIYWKRDKNEELIPEEGTVKIESLRLHKALKIQQDNLEKEKNEDNIAIYKRTIEILEEQIKETDYELKIRYIPLIYCELQFLKRGLGINGEKIKDFEAHLCANKCIEPKRTYSQWRDMKDPKEKIEIADFIYRNSIPTPETTKAEEEVFQMLQRLV